MWRGHAGDLFLIRIAGVENEGISAVHLRAAAQAETVWFGCLVLVSRRAIRARFRVVPLDPIAVLDWQCPKVDRSAQLEERAQGTCELRRGEVEHGDEERAKVGAERVRRRVLRREARREPGC